MTNYEVAQYVYERRNKYLSELKNFSFDKSPGLNAYRIRARVEQGGHDVPEEKIYDRYDRFLDNIKELVQMILGIRKRYSN